MAGGSIRSPGAAGRQHGAGHALPGVGGRVGHAAGQAGVFAAGTDGQVSRHRGGAPAGHLRAARRRAAGGDGGGGGVAAGEAAPHVPAGGRGRGLALRPGCRGLAVGVAGGGNGHGLPAGAGVGPSVGGAARPGPRRRADDRRIAQPGAAGQLPTELCRSGRNRSGIDNA